MNVFESLWGSLGLRSDLYLKSEPQRLKMILLYASRFDAHVALSSQCDA